MNKTVFFPSGNGKNKINLKMNTQERFPIYEKLSNINSITNNLKDLNLQPQISSPRIVVIGKGSAGKTSVLEALIGIDFLPKGEVINTL